MEEIQQLFNSLMQQMENNFQHRLQILNKRYHVMESNLKSKIKHLEQKPIKKDDMEIAKLKAKIFSLEHQLENFQPHMQKEPQNISQSEVLQSMIDNLQINIIDLYPQIDNIMPNLIELLPIQTSLLIDLTLLLYKNKFYSDFKLDQQILDKRTLTESLEQQVNDVMLASGQAKTYEISFNPKTEYWKKKLKLKSQDIEKKTYSLRLIQSQKVQDHIIKLMKTHLEETFFKINRDNPKFNYQQIPIYVQRINSILMLLMLSDNEQDFLIAIKNLTFDLNSKNTIVQRYLCVQINQRQIDQLLFLRILDFEKSVEILFNSLQLMQAMKAINIENKYIEQVGELICVHNEKEVNELFESLQ